MYDELVAWLRSWSELPAHCENYESCEECDKQDLCSTFTNERIITKAEEAADAIEELRAAVEGYEANTNMVFDRSGNNTVVKFEPKWIPVTERLPEIRKVVLITDGSDVGTGWMNQGWWNTSFADIQRDAVSHWMPLPQPPKEET